MTEAPEKRGAGEAGRVARAMGALRGLALGEAIGFPALFARIHALPERRRATIWRMNDTLTEERIAALCLPFTHRTDPDTLAPAPGCATEWALFSAQALLAAPAGAADPFLAAWQRDLAPRDASPSITGFSERAALENLRRGVLPPASGNDNPLHYEDRVALRAIASGIARAGDPDAAAALAAADAAITNAADGVWAAAAMAAAVAALVGGASLAEALAHGRAAFPPDSWIAHGDALARACRADAATPLDLALHLTRRVINSVYSFGGVAPETVPAAFALIEATGGDGERALLTANTIAKAAGSLPALVAALAGAAGGLDGHPAWADALGVARGAYVPAVAGMALDTTARALLP